jgi:hypothetical protein
MLILSLFLLVIFPPPLKLLFLLLPLLILHILGIIKKPQIIQYWSTDEVLSTPFFSKTMSRNRYEEISR